MREEGAVLTYCVVTLGHDGEGNISPHAQNSYEKKNKGKGNKKSDKRKELVWGKEPRKRREEKKCQPIIMGGSKPISNEPFMRGYTR